MGRPPTQLRNADTELLRRHLAGDGEAFAAIVRRHVDLVHSSARRRVPADAEDVTQAVFLTLLNKPHQAAAACQRSGGLPAWLLAVTKNHARNAAKRRRRRAHHERRLATMTPTAAIASGDPTAALAWAEIAPLLDDAVLALPAADREAILMKFYENRPATEIAESLGLSHDAARQRISRALAKLRKRLARQGVEVPAATLAGLLTAHAVTAAPASLALTCTTLAAGGTATAAALALTQGSTMTTTMILKLAAAATVGTVAVGLTTGDPADSASQPVAAAPPASTVPADVPAPPPDEPQTPADEVPVPTPDDYLPLNEVVTRILPDGREQFIDFDTGRQFNVDRRGIDDWEFIESRGVDAYTHVRDDDIRIDGTGIAVKAVPTATWDDDERGLRQLEDLRSDRLLASMQGPGVGDENDMNGYGGLPRTWLFVTREGGAGVLQIIDSDAKTDRITVQYKLLARGLLPKPPEDDLETFMRFSSREERLRYIITPPHVGYEGPVPAPQDMIISPTWAAAMPGLAFFPANPRDGRRPVAFEATEIPDAGEPWERSVFVGFSDASTRQIIDPTELARLLEQAGGKANAVEPRVEAE